jgi:hypothetical protein
MPEGVEHCDFVHLAEIAGDVNLPLMPEGVEHLASSTSTRRGQRSVNLPLMPEGVEH